MVAVASSRFSLKPRIVDKFIAKVIKKVENVNFIEYFCMPKDRIMSIRIGVFWELLNHYKYLIVVVLGVLVVGVIDDNSFMRRIQYEMQISELKEEIERYNHRNDLDSKQLKELKHDPKAIEKIARERYFMKADDEDIYVLSDDIKPDNSNETIE